MNFQWRANMQRTQRFAFTLIELLVVIAIIAVLIALLIPGLAKAKLIARQTREAAALHSLVIAYTAYADDNKGKLMPGYLKTSWVTPGQDPRKQIEVRSNDQVADDASRLYGTIAKRYPFRILPYINYSYETLVIDKQLRADMTALPQDGSSRTSREYAISYNPSFGMNTTYIGGDSQKGGFSIFSLARYNMFYVTQIEQPNFPSQLMIFTTARGVRANTQEEIVSGKHRIEGPWQIVGRSGRIPTFGRWQATGWDPAQPPAAAGHVDLRHSRKCLIATFDGHVEAIGFEQLNDMRRWCNLATDPNWHPQ